MRDSLPRKMGQDAMLAVVHKDGAQCYCLLGRGWVREPGLDAFATRGCLTFPLGYAADCEFAIDC